MNKLQRWIILALWCVTLFWMPLIAQAGSTASTLSKGLIGHWPLTTKAQDATYDAKDVTPYSQHGTGTAVTVGATYTEFNGSTYEVDIGGNVIGTGDITWSGWFYTQGEGQNANIEMIYDNGNFMVFWYEPTLQILGRSNAVTTATSAGIINRNTWYHLVFTRPSGGANANIYINGALSGSANQNTGTPAAGSGNDLIGSDQARNFNFDGYLHDIRIYNRILSQAEITLLYNSGE